MDAEINIDENATVRPAVTTVRRTAVSGVVSLGDLLAESADHAEPVVDRDTESGSA